MQRKHGETLKYIWRNKKNYSNTKRIPPHKTKRYEKVEFLGLGEFRLHPVKHGQESFACTFLFPDLLIHDN